MACHRLSGDRFAYYAVSLQALQLEFSEPVQHSFLHTSIYMVDLCFYGRQFNWLKSLKQEVMGEFQKFLNSDTVLIGNLLTLFENLKAALPGRQKCVCSTKARCGFRL
ncbi:MAG: hypothetical protein AAF609_18195 [Cyanobacteria bacterium P01_C01_bin.120]